MKRVKTVGIVLFTGALLAALSGCEKQDGPAEQAGEKLDKAMQDAGDKADEKLDKAMQDAGDKADETLDRIGEQIEQTGEKIQQADE